MQYFCADGSAATVRAMGLTYPSGRSLSFDYGASGTVQENEYDGRNFRVVRKDYSSGTLTETRHVYYTSAWQVLEERLDALQAGNWNVTALCDENGDVQERYAYTAYGEPPFLLPGVCQAVGEQFRVGGALHGASVGWGERVVSGASPNARLAAGGLGVKRSCSTATGAHPPEAPLLPAPPVIQFQSRDP